jgi:hypothetical protein
MRLLANYRATAQGVGLSALEVFKTPVAALEKASNPSSPLIPLRQKKTFPNNDLRCILEIGQEAVETFQEVPAGATGRSGDHLGLWVSGYGVAPTGSVVHGRFHVRLFGIRHSWRTR